MGPNPTKIAGGAVLIAVLLAPASAVAQWNDQPYQFRNSPPRAGAGMSTAYRQAMLIEEIEGRRPGAILRGPGGALLEVQRFRRQAFAVAPEPDYLPSVTRVRGAVISGVAVQAWTLQMSAPELISTHGGTIGRTPIDSWVAMLD